MQLSLEIIIENLLEMRVKTQAALHFLVRNPYKSQNIETHEETRPLGWRVVMLGWSGWGVLGLCTHTRVRKRKHALPPTAPDPTCPLGTVKATGGWSHSVRSESPAPGRHTTGMLLPAAAAWVWLQQNASVVTQYQQLVFVNTKYFIVLITWKVNAYWVVGMECVLDCLPKALCILIV